MDFPSALIWVQIWGLPINEKIPQIGLKPGEKLREVCEANVFEKSDQTIIVKVKVSLSIHMLIKLKYTSEVRLPIFCFKFRLMGHIYEHLNNSTNHEHGITEINPLGPWLKTN